MARPTEIEVHYDRKVQIEQFEPVSFGGTVTVALEEGDDHTEVYNKYASEIEDAVERELARRIARKKADAGDD